MTAIEHNMNRDLNLDNKIYNLENSNDESEVLGTSGLYNMGNTCYMNSIVQCLSNCELFRQYILSNRLIPDLLKNKEINSHQLTSNVETFLSFQLRKIIINIWNSSFYSFRPISFKKLFGKKIEMFQNSAQHDSQEALLCILDTFNEEIGNEIFIKSNINTITEDKFNFLLKQDNLSQEQTALLIDLIKKYENDYIHYVSKENFLDFYKKKYSIICNIFGGRIISELKCPVTEISKVNFEPFFLLSLSIPHDKEEKEQSSDISSEISPEKNNDSNKLSDKDYDYESESDVSMKNEDVQPEFTDKNYSSKDYCEEDGSDEEIYNQNLSSNNSILESFGTHDEDGYFEEDNESSKNISNKSDSDNESTKSDSDNESNKSDSNESCDSNTDYLNLFKKKYTSSKNETNQNELSEFNLQECLEMYFRPEKLDDENKWFSPYANLKVNAIKHIKLWESPNILIIHLKRFKKTIYGTAEKITNKINFPIEGLDISQYHHKSSTCKNNIYDLFAINNHTNFNKFGFNGISFGHYYSYCKNVTNNKWYNYNDESVTEISMDKLITSDAYILFYKLRE